MKLLISVFVGIFLTQCLHAAKAEQIKLHVDFENLRTERGQDGKTRISLPGLLNTVQGGLPSVPVKTLKLALPSGTQIKGFTYRSQERSIEKLSLDVSLGQRPISYSLEEIESDLKESFIPAPSIESASFPNNRVEIDTQVLHGVKIAIINLYPVLVMRGNKQIERVDSIDLTIDLERVNSPPYPLFKHQLDEVKRVVDNSNILEANTELRTQTRDSYDYLILATEKMINYNGTNGISDLIAVLESKGLKAKVLDVGKLTAEGLDQVEKIRNTIRAEHDTNGIQYVLLLGRSVNNSSETYIPAPKLWSKIKAYFGSGWVDLQEFIPADVYYSCLDGSFNGNNNEKWGEPSDGDNGGDVDFLPEVTVGRMSLNSDKELQNFVSKTLKTRTKAIPKKVLLLGESLFPELGLYGDDYMNQLLGDSDDHGFKTNGYKTDWTANKLYDKSRAWTGSQAVTLINSANFGMINHLGHSNQSFNMKLSSAAIAGLKNPIPYFYYTQGCFAGDFVFGSWTNKLVAADYAAFAAVANSTYGLAPEDPTPTLTKTPGASHMLHRQFIHYVFSPENNSLAKAHQLSKQAFIGLKSAMEIRWVNWGATFFGEPSTQLQFE